MATGLTISSFEKLRSKSHLKSWWQNLSICSQLIFLLVALIFQIMLVLIIVMSVILTQSTTETINPSKEICNDPDCINSAVEILRSMDFNVDPCENFYEFACGNYEKSSGSQDTKTVETEIDEQIISKVKTLLDGDDVSYIEENSIQKYQRLAKDLYITCLDKSSIDRNIDDEIENVLQTFKWYENFKKNLNVDEFNWASGMEDLAQMGLPFDLFVSGSLTNVIGQNYTIVNVESPNVNPEDEVKYEDGIKLGEKLNDLKIDEEANEEIYTLEEIGRKFNSSSLRKYIERTLAPNIIGNRLRIRTSRSFLENFEKVLTETTKTEQVSYVLNRILSYAKQFRNVPLEPRSIFCTEVVMRSLPEATGSMFIRTFFQKESKPKAEEIASDIKTELIKAIRNTKWIDSDSQNTAVNKAEDITLQVAYPEEYLSDRKMTELYKEVDDVKNFMKTKLKLNVFDRSVKSKVNWTKFGNVLKTEIEYKPDSNTLQIPAGYLQDPLFGPSKLKYINYGKIGWSIGQKMFQAFDINNFNSSKIGKHYGKWSNEAAGEYNTKMNCITMQYSDLNRKIDGAKSIIENFSDSEGLRKAYLAYVKHVNENGQEKLSPGLKYSHLQMFWISAASSKCAKYSEKDYVAFFERNQEHIPNEYRVNGAFRNSEHFSRDFNCKSDTKMNPRDKCTIWDQ